jgi:hypothetical protein
MSRQAHSYPLGKVDFRGKGRKDCLAVITWELKDGRFSMCAEIWNPRKSDIYMGGQCVDEVAAYFPNDAKAQRMVAIWREWHLNDMQAGTPAQMAFLKTAGTHGYVEACDALDEVGLLIHNGHKYGSAWLKVELPAHVVAEIQSWSGVAPILSTQGEAPLFSPEQIAKQA